MSDILDLEPAAVAAETPVPASGAPASSPTATPESLPEAEAIASALLKARWPDALEFAGKVVLPASIALYVAGFMGAVPHYVRFGVPISSLPNTTFVGAGLLLAALVTLAATSLVMLSHSWRSRRWRLFAGEVLLLIGGCHFLARWAGLGGFLFVLATATFPLLRKPYRWLEIFPPERPASAIWTAFIMGTLAMAGFATLALPNAVPQLGGARPTPLASVILGPHTSTLDPPDQWMKNMCQTPLSKGGGETCRHIFKVHEDGQYLYLLAEDSRPPCGPHWQHQYSFAPSGSAGCVARIANSQIQLMHYDIGPLWE